MKESLEDISKELKKDNSLEKKIISLDPSGNGTTGILVIEKNNSKFLSYKNKNWEEHLNYIFDLVEKEKPSIIIYENTNYVHKRTLGTLSLFKLIGGIVSLKNYFKFTQRVEGVAVNQVKSFKKKLFSNEERLENLNFEIGRGKGWNYCGKKINLHQLDSLIVYHLWSGGILEEKKRIEEKILFLKNKKRLGKEQKRKLEILENILLEKECQKFVQY